MLFTRGNLRENGGEIKTQSALLDFCYLPPILSFLIKRLIPRLAEASDR
jgi:hypothetical protein